MLRYLSFLKLCDCAFVLFMVSWLVTRHILFIWVIYSAYSESYKYMPFDWDPAREYYFTKEVYTAFIAMLVALQVNLRISQAQLPKIKALFNQRPSKFYGSS